MKKYLMLATLLFAVIALPAQATTAEGQATNITNGGGVCKGPYTRYEEALRYRPLAVVNESTKDVFVNCWFTVWEEAADGFGGVERVSMMLRNQGTAQKTVQCMLVIGNDGTPRQTETLNIVIPGGVRKLAEWTRSGTGFQGQLSVQCLLPPNVAINETSAHWDYNDQT